ncbi:MAG: glutathione S-transferase N-terminal domain-containing protein [Acidobacteriota bacterium]|nr:glutathione S-transferase N-terminal domain-containing protein [Acidobacteriota bacterium]
MAEIIVYCTRWCADCRRAKSFLEEHGVAYREFNIDEFPEAADLVVRVNNGRRKVPTLMVNGRYVACSPFDPYQFAEELNVPLHAGYSSANP